VIRAPWSDQRTVAPANLASAIGRQVLDLVQESLRGLRNLLSRMRVAESGAPEASYPKVPIPAPGRRKDGEGADGERAHGAQHRMADLLRGDADLPRAYGSNRLVLLARDPYCLFAYWDISEERRHTVREQAGAGAVREVLRTYDVTQLTFDARPASRFQDFPVAAGVRSLYAYVGKPAACFRAEIGYLRFDGVFFTLAGSEPVWMARTDEPGAEPGRWMTVRWSERPEARAVTTSAGPTMRGAATGTAPTRAAPSSWQGAAPAAAAIQRGSWSLVRGGASGDHSRTRGNV